MFWYRFGVASCPPFPPDVATTGSPTEISLLSHGTPRFRCFKPLLRVSVFELSLSLQNRPQDLKHRLGPRTRTNPDFEFLVRQRGDEKMKVSCVGKEHRGVAIACSMIGTSVHSPEFASGIRSGFDRRTSEIRRRSSDDTGFRLSIMQLGLVISASGQSWVSRVFLLK